MDCLGNDHSANIRDGSKSNGRCRNRPIEPTHCKPSNRQWNNPKTRSHRLHAHIRRVVHIRSLAIRRMGAVPISHTDSSRFRISILETIHMARSLRHWRSLRNNSPGSTDSNNRIPASGVHMDGNRRNVLGIRFRHPVCHIRYRL